MIVVIVLVAIVLVGLTATAVGVYKLRVLLNKRYAVWVEEIMRVESSLDRIEEAMIRKGLSG